MVSFLKIQDYMFDSLLENERFGTLDMLCQAMNYYLVDCDPLLCFHILLFFPMGENKKLTRKEIWNLLETDATPFS